MRYCLVVLLFLPIIAFCQDNETTESDTVKQHSVKKAVLLSIVPGGGQIYNHMAMPKGRKKAYWKVPLIYAGLGASGYFLVSNQIEKNRLKEEYSYRQDNGGLPLYDQWKNIDDQGVLTLYNQYLNWRDLSILAVGAVYVIQLVDAGVEAHFVNFDVSEDLSLSVNPSFVGGYNPGISLSLNFR